MIGALIGRKAVASAFDAMNRHDLPRFMSAWRDDGTFIYPGDIPESGTFKGKPAVEAWFRHFFEEFPSIRFEVQNICVQSSFDVLGNNVLIAHWNVELTNRNGVAGKNSGISVITAKGGKVLAVKDFIFDLSDNFRRYWGHATPESFRSAAGR